MRFLLFLFACYSFHLAAHPLEQQPYREVEELLIELKLEAAQTLVNGMPTKGYRAFYQNTIDLYRAVSSMNPAHSEIYKQDWDEKFESVNGLPDADPLREVMLAEMSAKRAIIEFIQHNYFSTVRYVRSARKYLDLSYARHGRMVEQLKLEGLFEVMLGSLPEQYHWIARPLGLSGNITTGVRYLRISATTCRLLTAESYLLLALVEKNILDQPAQTLHRLSNYQRRRANRSILIDFFLASCHQRLKQNEASLRILSDRSAYPASQVGDFPFWDYLSGKAWYFHGNMVRARTAFSAFLDGYRGNLFRIDATFRIGMSWLLDGQAEQAAPWFQAIVNADDTDRFDEDEYAANMSEWLLADAPGPVLLHLFRARNAYDGGYFSRAKDILEQTCDSYALRPWEWVEWHYRMGRILHDEQNNAEAATHYRSALRYEANAYNSWLQAYACFYLGNIAADAGHESEARKWIGQALEMDDYFYQAGLENRCKSLLSAMDHPQEETSSNRR